MIENCETKISVFSGMYSLIFKHSKEESSLRLPNIFSDEIREVEEVKPKKEVKKITKRRSKKKPKKRITACPHINKRHYAKNMCNNCYHKSGRQKSAWACLHLDRMLYAKGMCQVCYLQSYHKDKSCKEAKINPLAI